MQNGYGLRYGTRFDDTTRREDLWFNYAPKMFSELQSEQVLILSGEPGAGKSHITADLFDEAFAHDMGVFMLSSHINGGNMKGRAATAECFETAQELGSDALVIVDNFDFAIYTGGHKKRKTNKQTDEYCRFITSSVVDCADAGCLVLGTIHSDSWRDNHSNAHPETKQLYQDTITKLGGATTFLGLVTEQNAVQIIQRRGIDLETAQAIARELKIHEALEFRQAHHINPDVWREQGAEVAIQQVNNLKDQKIAGGA